MQITFAAIDFIKVLSSHTPSGSTQILTDSFFPATATLSICHMGNNMWANLCPCGHSVIQGTSIISSEAGFFLELQAFPML